MERYRQTPESAIYNDLLGRRIEVSPYVNFYSKGLIEASSADISRMGEDIFFSENGNLNEVEQRIPENYINYLTGIPNPFTKSFTTSMLCAKLIEWEPVEISLQNLYKTPKAEIYTDPIRFALTFDLTTGLLNVTNSVLLAGGIIAGRKIDFNQVTNEVFCGAADKDGEKRLTSHLEKLSERNAAFLRKDPTGFEMMNSIAENIKETRQDPCVHEWLIGGVNVGIKFYKELYLFLQAKSSNT